jgi:AraC family transcriptional regulator
MPSSCKLRAAEYEPLGTMAPHHHDEASFGVIVGGGFTERVGRSERRYASGYVTFGPAGVTHSQQFGPSGARQIIVRPDDGWLAYLADSKVNLADSPYAHAPLFDLLGTKLLRELERDDDFSAIACEGIMLEIVAAFGRMRIDRATEPPGWLRMARDYLHANACASLTMKEIALAVQRHEIHLAREFRRFFGVSIGSYRRQLRTERAAHLLRHSSSDITDIALHCGFASHSHLCRVFRAQFGMSPSRYRAQR